MDPVDSPLTQPFHAGECQVQDRAGVGDRMQALGGRLIRDHMPDQHRELYGKLPTLLVGSLDAQGRPWASMLVGRPGFVSTPDERRMRVATRPDADDPLAGALALGARLGVLGLEPATRRRNRMNGRVVALDAGGFEVAVEQSFGNCPKYIQAREPAWREAAATAREPPLAFAGTMPDAAAALVGRSDTLFIASAATADASTTVAEGVDVSHRGGRPGFVRVGRDAQGAHVLTLPDFSGNNLFNTLGNIAAYPQAGLLFFDPEQGHRLQLSGRAELLWDGPELAGFVGALRLLRIVVEAGRYAPAALPLRWSAAQPAPQLAQTGVWAAPA